MKALLLTTAMAVGLGLPALAQDAASPFQTEPTGPSVPASELIGARIYATDTQVDAEAYTRDTAERFTGNGEQGRKVWGLIG